MQFEHQPQTTTTPTTTTTTMTLLQSEHYRVHQQNHHRHRCDTVTSNNNRISQIADNTEVNSPYLVDTTANTFHNANIKANNNNNTSNNSNSQVQEDDMVAGNHGDDDGGGCCQPIIAADILTVGSAKSICLDEHCRTFSPHHFSRLWTTIAAILLVLVYCDVGNAALRNVNLFIEPPAVRRGQSVTLRCNYDLEGAPLYSVKYYRGQMEFFRYTPGEYPSTKVFYLIRIKVDESVSNATQVVVRNVNFGLSGNFSCEVTADAPLFSTATAYAQMQVVEFPEKRPQLFTEHTRYEPGDVLRANCSTPPSRPRVDLRFTINNIPVSSEETQYIRTVDNLIASRLSLKLQLQGVHFAGGANSHMMNTLGIGGFSSSSIGSSGGGGGGGSSSLGVPYNSLNNYGPIPNSPAGGLVLRCTAQIEDLYQEYKEIELGTPQKDPVPARVTLSSGSGLRNFFESYFSATSAAAATTLRQPLTAASGCSGWLTILLAVNFILVTGVTNAFQRLPGRTSPPDDRPLRAR